jgi:hypothetical protein
MARNPHFDRETITEDIGFRGPHFNENVEKEFSFGLPGLAQQAQQSWSPGGEFGQQGEFQGWRAKEESTPYRQNWEYDNMPGGEFTTGPNLLSPYRYPQDDVNILERGPGPWNDFRMGMEPWPMYHTFEPMFDEEELLQQLKLQSNLDNWELFHLMSNGYTLEEAQAELERQLG